MNEHPAGLWPSLKATTRIIEATKSQPADNDALRGALHDFHREFVEHASLASAGKMGRPRIAAELANHARAILEFFDKPTDRLLDFHLWWSCDTINRKTFTAALQEFAAATDTIPTWRGGLKGWLADSLVPIFRANFSEARFYTRDPDSGIVDGPFVRFVQAVGREISIDGEPYEISAETIVQAVKRTPKD